MLARPAVVCRQGRGANRCREKRPAYGGHARLAQPRCGTKAVGTFYEAGVRYNPFRQEGDRRWKHWFVQPELRYWMCQPYGGHFFGQT